MKYIIPILIAILLSACSTQQVVQHKQTDIQWPDPIQQYDGQFIVKTDVNGNLYVSQTVEDSANLRIWLNDILRYTKDLQQMVCYYKDTASTDQKCIEKIKEP